MGPNQPNVVAIDHNNGPAMHPNQATTLATFSSGEHSGRASIIGDSYGSGKVILVSPHPEHDYLQNCDVVTYAAAYAAGVVGPGPTPLPSPSPAPVPTPSPSACHAISAVVSDDWCKDNCAQGFCP